MNANIFWTKGYIQFIVVLKILSPVYVDKAAEIPPCIDDTVPCMKNYTDTMTVCEHAPGYSNMSLIVPSDTMTQDITIIVKGEQFSMGNDIAGVFHVGDKDINRWVNRIRRPEQNILTYEIWNARTQYTDEFYCQYELDIGGQKFRSDFFKWFAVEKCPPPSESSMPGKEAQQLNATCEEDPLKNRTEKINASASECEELKTMISNLQQNLSELEKYAKTALQRSVHSDDQMEKVLEELGNVNKTIGTHNKKQDISSKMDIMICILLFFSTAKILNVTSLVRSLLNMVSRCPVGSRSNDPMSLSPHLSINDSDYPDDPLVITASNQPNFKEETESLHISPSDENSEETMDEHTNGQALGQEQQGQSLSWESTSTSTHCQCNIDMTSGILVPKETEDLQSE